MTANKMVLISKHLRLLHHASKKEYVLRECMEAPHALELDVLKFEKHEAVEYIDRPLYNNFNDLKRHPSKIKN